MKKILFGIFAHPDDEAFGPSGTLLKMSRSGYDVHLICATSGERGINADGYEDLGAVRLQEWRKAGELMEVSSQHHLGYRDGELCNNTFHEIAAAVEKCISRRLKAYRDAQLEITFMTFDQNGISGHIDHIVMSMVASYAYYKKAAHSPTVRYKELRYFCISSDDFPLPDTGYVFMPAGRDQQLIDITEDVADVADEKRAIMCAHYSQRSDAETLLKRKSTLSTEHFYKAQ